MKTSIGEVSAYLRKSRIPIRLSCTTKSGWPTIISLWYLYQDDKLFCATQESSRIVTYLRQNPKCAFEIAADTPPYCGVRGQAIADINKTLGVDILEKLLVRYLGGIDNTLAQDLLSKKDHEVAIVLDPIRVYQWNYSNRMQDIITSEQGKKICP